MADKIKSVVILKKILGLLHEKVKLKLLAYNKSLKAKFYFDIIDYKKNAENEIIDENGKKKKKSLVTNFISYEGGYLFGKKHGEGKDYKLLVKKDEPFWKEKYKNEVIEFIKKRENFQNTEIKEEINKEKISKNWEECYSIILEFEGNYEKGIRQGKGKEYNNKGGLIFEGNFEKGKRQGNGKEYNDKGELIFEGEYKEGKKWNGKGKEYNDKGELIFEGEYKEGKKWNGKGKKYYLNGKLSSKFEYLNGFRNGKLFEYYENEKLKFDGTEQEIKCKGKTYYGKKGKEYDTNGNVIYQGEFFNCRRWEGIGKEYNDKGELIFEGEYKEGERWEGTGKEYKDKGELIFEGKYKNGKRWEGTGKEYKDKEELIFEGEYKEGKKWEGIGKEYDGDGNVFLKKKYNNGKCDVQKVLKGKRKIYDDKNNFLYEIDYDKSESFTEKEKHLEIYSTSMGENRLKTEIGKEIDFTDDSIFEGEFLNGKRLNGTLRKYNKLKIEKKNKIVLILEAELKNGVINGKVKEYSKEGELKFEGEYLNGKRNGKGKEYEPGEFTSEKVILIFDGEYLNGEKNGKGKEYNKLYGNIIFEGEFQNGKRLRGKEYDDYDNIIFNGEYLNGKRWSGKVNEKKKNIKFDGEYIKGEKKGKETVYANYDKKISEFNIIDGKRNGNGKEYNKKGNIIFEGNYQDGKKNGKGIEYNDEQKKIFEGEYIKEKKWNGKEYDYIDNTIFIQEYKNGERIDKIIMKEYLKNKLLFEGESLNRKRNGKGIEYFNGKKIFEGAYLDGKRNGTGTEYNFEGGKFVGEFKSGKKWNGTGYNKNGTIEYNIIDGYGYLKEYHCGRLIYEGYCLDGKRHGKGKIYNFLTRKVIYEGIFAYGNKLD